MKKFFAWAMALAMLLSVGFLGLNPTVSYADDDENVISFSDVIDIASNEYGTKAGANSGHGNHQTRVVRTSHGVYACYITDNIPNEAGGKEMDQMTIFKIDSEKGTSSVLYQFYKPYDTSQTAIIVDKDENVWAVVCCDNKLKDQFDGRQGTMWCAAYRVDAETDEVQGYKTLISFDATGNGFGYASFFYDESTNRIHTVGFDGNNDIGYFRIATFDCDEGFWYPELVSIPTGNRHAYPFMIADGKGGAFIVIQEDKTCIGAGYTEVQSNTGLSDQELATFSRWSAGYVWDQLNYFYVTDLTTGEYVRGAIAEKDYSRVIGDQDYRNSLAGRSTNEYPNFQMNNGGDMIIDSDGYLHVIYNKAYSLAAYTRALTESTWYHDVYDISDSQNITLLSSSNLGDEVALGYDDIYWRIYEDSQGNLYYINAIVDDGIATLYVRELVGTPSTGYTHKLLGKKNLPKGSALICVANSRSGSLIDDQVSVIFMSNDDYDYIEIDLHQWDSKYTVDKAPTCYSTGSKSIHCKHCDAVKDVTTIAKKAHTYGDWEEHTSTCTEEGWSSRTCTVCNHMETIGLDLADHKSVLVKGYEATCEKEGLTDGYVCEDCGEVLVAQEKIAALGHKSDGKFHFDDNGHWHVCENCNEKLDCVEHTLVWTETDTERVGKCECGYTKTEQKEVQKVSPWVFVGIGGGVAAVAAVSITLIALKKKKKS